jgi:integrase
MAKDLTQVAIDKLKPGPSRREVPDGHTRGLLLVVQPTGKMGWALRYRFHGRPRKYTIGDYPGISLQDARAAASRALAAIAADKDPAAEKQAAKAAARAARRQTSDAVEKVIDDFISLHAKPNTRDWKETQRLLSQFAKAWEGRRLAVIGKPDIHRILDGIVARGAPVGANRAFAQLRKMCRWAVSRGIIERSPCEGIEPPSTETVRDRVLSLDELRLVWRAADKLGFPFGPITKLLILTSQRRSEVGGMEWNELDLENRLWTIPASRSKNRRQHAIPLSLQVIEIIKWVPRFSGSRFLFSPGKAAPSGFSKAKERLDRFIVRDNGSPIAPWIMHDIRRSAATGLAGLGVNLPVIERILNHVSGSFAGVVGIYQRHTFPTEMRDAMERWGRRIESLVSGEAGNVIEFTGLASVLIPLAEKSN